jgi:ABC-type uncharacterized transport system permease subunit
MISTIHFLNIFLPLLYGVTLLVYLYDFVKDTKSFTNAKRIFLFLTLMVHIFYLLARTIEFDHTPITNKFEIFTLLAFSISFSYFVLELLTDVRGTGLFIILFSLIFQVISSLFIEDLFEVAEVLRNRLLGLHVISAMLGYSGFTLAAVYGLLYSMLYKEIKLNKFGLIFKRLPSLETLYKLSFNSVLIGFALLTFAVIIGIIWLPSAFPNFSYFDPKLITTGMVWLIFGALVFFKFFANWQGKKVINVALIGYGVMILSVILSIVFASSFHSFY